MKTKLISVVVSLGLPSSFVFDKGYDIIGVNLIDENLEADPASVNPAYISIRDSSRVYVDTVPTQTLQSVTFQGVRGVGLEQFYPLNIENNQQTVTLELSKPFTSKASFVAVFLLKETSTC